MSIFNQDIYKNYYNSEEASKPFKSCIHICYCIQFPDRVWKNIKEFIMMTKKQRIICKSIYKKGYYIERGDLIIKQKFNNYAYRTKKKGYLRIYDIFTDMGDFGNNLKINEKLKTLIITNNYINLSKNSSLFYDALKINTRLTKLSLCRCNMINLENLVEALKINKNINYLSLEDNMIRNIEGMSNMLKTNTTLRYVSFKDNYITSIKTLCEALKTNETLTRLNLSRNRLGNHCRDHEGNYIKYDNVPVEDRFGYSLIMPWSDFIHKIQDDMIRGKMVYSSTWKKEIREINRDMIVLVLCFNDITDSWNCFPSWVDIEEDSYYCSDNTSIGFSESSCDSDSD